MFCQTVAELHFAELAIIAMNQVQDKKWPLVKNLVWVRGPKYMGSAWIRLSAEQWLLAGARGLGE